MNLVFMNHLWRYYFPLAVVIIYTLNVNSEPLEVHDDDSVDLPDDFMKYVKQLGASVFKVTDKTIPERVTEEMPTNSTRAQNRRKFNRIISKSTQNAALRDILMLKLVSYYEDKYKLSRSEAEMTTARLRTSRRPIALDRLFGSNPTYSRHTRYNSRHSAPTKRTIARRRVAQRPQTELRRPSIATRYEYNEGYRLPDVASPSRYGPAAEVVAI